MEWLEENNRKRQACMKIVFIIILLSLSLWPSIINITRINHNNLRQLSGYFKVIIHNLQMKIYTLSLLCGFAFALTPQKHENFLDDIGNFFNQAADKVATTFPEVKDKVFNKVNQISNTVPQKVSDGIDHVGDKVIGAKDKVEEKLNPLPINMPTYSEDSQGNLQVSQPYSVEPQPVYNSQVAGQEQKKSHKHSHKKSYKQAHKNLKH